MQKKKALNNEMEKSLLKLKRVQGKAEVNKQPDAVIDLSPKWFLGLVLVISFHLDENFVRFSSSIKQIEK